MAKQGKKKSAGRAKSRHVGSRFDDFLAEEGIGAEVKADAAKRVMAYRIAELMNELGWTKAEMARRMGTSRSSLDRLLDPTNSSLTLVSMQRAAEVLGKRLVVDLE